MSTTSPLLVLADDLTGAAEIAAIAHQHGLSSTVCTRPGSRLDSEVVVFDTDTRLLSPTRAAQRVKTFLKELPLKTGVDFFKKTDSVLRGPVLAEIDACLRALGRQHTLLLPCNPSLGRTIRSGNYFVHDIPLNQTHFARDPHHPRLTSDARTLLSEKATPQITIGDASSTRDIRIWADKFEPGSLPAGGADFFRAWLARVRPRNRIVVPPRPTLPAPALVVSGTTIPLPKPLAKVALPLLETPRADVAEQLRTRKFSVLATPLTRLANPKQLPRLFAERVGDLHQEQLFAHLVIAGGATASACLEQLSWSELRVTHVWEPGIVTLQPAAAERCCVTLKPGSYAWPAGLLRTFLK